MPEDDGYSSDTLNLLVKGVDPYGESTSFYFDIIVIENNAPILSSKFQDLSFYN